MKPFTISDRLTIAASILAAAILVAQIIYYLEGVA